MWIKGAVYLLWGSYRLGHMLVFAGWTINFYGMIVFFAGYQALGKPLVGPEIVEVAVTAFLSLLFMIWSDVVTVRERIKH